MSEQLMQVRDALVAANITGPHTSHSRRNVIGKIHGIIAGDTEYTFGLSGLNKYSAMEILGFVGDLMGFAPDIELVEGFDDIDPQRTIDGILGAARRLRDAGTRGESLFIATGHPTGLLEHHIRVADAYRRAGGKIVRPREEEQLASRRGRHIEVRYIGNVACLADWGQLRHTHSADAMEILLDSAPWPDLVFADHGFAGAAVERGIPTIAVMDINDPALAVAWAEGRDVVIVPMDDNRPPRLYEPSWELFEAVLDGGAL
jgi:Phosphatase